MKVAVIGCGYVGLITGVGLALKGHKVSAIDIDQSRVEHIGQGIVPFYEPGVVEGLKKCLKNGNLGVFRSIDYAADCDVVLICVQTPPKPNGAINLQILEAAARDLQAVFASNPRSRTVVVRSTIVPGTTDSLVIPIFNPNEFMVKKVGVVFNPEFLREGSALMDFLSPDRIVIGTHSKKAARVLKKMYAPFKTPMVTMTPSTAELAKYTSNALLATLVSFSNEIARICERTSEVDVEDVLGIIHRDRRFRSGVGAGDGVVKPGILSYLRAGCGFGGSCLPKDLSALIVYAHSLDQDTPLLNAVAEVNIRQPARVVEMTANLLGGLTGRKIAVLGAAFKGGTDDLRESPGLKIVDELLARKAKVIIYDPLVKESGLLSYLDKGVVVAPTLLKAIENAEVCIVTSNSPQFKKISRIKNKSFKIVDCRGMIKHSINSADDYFAVGRSMDLQVQGKRNSKIKLNSDLI